MINIVKIIILIKSEKKLITIRKKWWKKIEKEKTIKEFF